MRRVRQVMNINEKMLSVSVVIARMKHFCRDFCYSLFVESDTAESWYFRSQ